MFSFNKDFYKSKRLWLGLAIVLSGFVPEVQGLIIQVFGPEVLTGILSGGGIISTSSLANKNE